MNSIVINNNNASKGKNIRKNLTSNSRMSGKFQYFRGPSSPSDEVSSYEHHSKMRVHKRIENHPQGE